MNRNEVALQALDLVNGNRQADYGTPQVNYARIARLWSVILEMEVTPGQVALCMAQVKIARLVKSPGHADSWVDAIGYLATGAEVVLEA